nr:aminotransferase class I/II-fold pyridoxal phosphate-dependent enzyme [Angustibacter aerolatus]
MPRDVLVVVDEAYTEFVRDPEVPDALALVRARPNVAVLRTFSKAYGLAGLRVGYAVAQPPVATALRKTALPFAVNSLAQAAAVASLAAGDEPGRAGGGAGRRARAGRRRAARAGVGPVRHPGQLRVVRRGGADAGAGAGVRRRRARRAALRHGRRPGDDRRDRGERPAARGRRSVPRRADRWDAAGGVTAAPGG